MVLDYHLAGKLVKRGVQYATSDKNLSPDTHFSHDDQVFMNRLARYAMQYSQSKEAEVQAYEAIIVLVTVIAFAFIWISFRYTVGELVSTLVMVEQPTTSITVTSTVPIEGTDPDAPLEKEPLMDEIMTVTKTRPVTRNLCVALRTLKRSGGFLARWRGLGPFMAYGIMSNVVYKVLAFVMTHILLIFLPFAFMPLLLALAYVATTVLLSRIHMTWTHIVISEPSPLPWFRRIPRGSMYFKALALPSFSYASAQCLTLAVPFLVAMSFGPVTLPQDEVFHAKNEVLRILTSLAALGFVSLAVLLPASVTLTRVEASLLPEDVETIVNFDRTLNGATVQSLGFGRADFRRMYDMAWRTFDKESRIRVVKFYAKYFLALVGIFTFFASLLVTEFAIFFGIRLVSFILSMSK